MLIVPQFSSPWPTSVQAEVRPDGQLFGIALDLYFRQATSGKPPKELPLFRAMQDAFERLSPLFHIEEYHGQVSQVTFNAPPSGQYKWARQQPQCELADLMIVAFRATPSPSVRLTMLQAKSERNFRSPDITQQPWFKGNLEQWDLLSRRPKIDGAYSTFNPPEGLLRDAILPSVGTFGFFYRNSSQSDYEVYYSRADNLQPTYNYANRYGGRLKVSNTPLMDQRHGFTEACLASNTPEFGALIYSHLIGTPLHRKADAYANGASEALRAWLIRNVRAAVNARDLETDGEGTEVGRAFLDQFGGGDEGNTPQGTQASSFGARSLVLIQTDASTRIPISEIQHLVEGEL